MTSSVNIHFVLEEGTLVSFLIVVGLDLICIRHIKYHYWITDSVHIPRAEETVILFVYYF